MQSESQHAERDEAIYMTAFCVTNIKPHKAGNWCRQKMATVQNKKGRFSKTGVVSIAKKIGEVKTSVVKDKLLIHQMKKTKVNHTIIMLAMKNYLKAAEK